MNKQELSAMVAEILQTMKMDNPSVAPKGVTAPLKGSLGGGYADPPLQGGGEGTTPPAWRSHATSPCTGEAFPTSVKNQRFLTASPQGEAFGRMEVEDISEIDLRKLYLQENAADKASFARLKMKTPARLASGRAGARYKTLTMLRFRADHAAAQDAVFSQVPEDFAGKHGLVAVKTRCEDKDQYLTRPDLGRCFDEENAAAIRAAIAGTPTVQVVVGDGLSSAACQANAMDCLAALRDGLKLRGIELGKTLFVRYCRVGAGDAVGDITGCKLVCMLVGERPGLVTDKSLSAYITYEPRTGVSESARTVVSNIHDQGTPAVEAGAHIAELIEMILKKKVSGVGLHLENAQ